jgi:hypothetical protein
MRAELVIEPLDTTGRIKSADECFIEAFHSPGANGSVRKLAAVQKPDSWEAGRPPGWYSQTLIKKYDRLWFEWEPETLWSTIEKDFNTAVSELTRNKINAAKLIYLTDAFWKEWHVFEKVVQAFTDHIPDFFSVEPPSPAEVAWGVYEVNRMRPNITFSEEVASYVQGICKEAGLVLFPEELEFAQPKPLGTLAADVRAGWQMIKELKEIEIVENEIGVNLVRLQAIRAYVEEQFSEHE